jgi:hypothetical protein|tara:strand:- start:17 stop:241 length:225 start_codon:yes stop_codon:yes gene_type:complete
MSFLMPKIPSPPPMIMPDVKDVPSFDDEERKKEELERLQASELKRTGRRSTIKTGTGLLSDPELYQKSLLGEEE